MSTYREPTQDASSNKDIDENLPILEDIEWPRANSSSKELSASQESSWLTKTPFNLPLDLSTPKRKHSSEPFRQASSTTDQRVQTSPVTALGTVYTTAPS